jgi:hypothetical protein
VDNVKMNLRKLDKMGKEYKLNGGEAKCIRNNYWEARRKETTGRPGHRWMGNVKWILER